MKLSLLAVLVATSTIAYGDDEWSTYESKDHQFAVAFPYEITVDSVSPASLTVTGSNTDDTINYGVDVFHVPLIRAAGENMIRTAIEGGVQASIKEFDGQITTDCEIVMFGRRGMSYAATGQNGGKPVFFCCRVFSIKDRLYLQRITQVGAASVSLQDAMQFFGSFTSSLEKDETPTDPSKLELPLEVVSWSARLAKGQFQNGYQISVKVKNREEKGIKLMVGGLLFNDLLGEQVYNIKLDPDKKVPAGATVEYNGFYPVNQFIPKDLRLSKMAKEDVKVKLLIGKVVFDDNSVVDFTAVSSR